MTLSVSAAYQLDHESIKTRAKYEIEQFTGSYVLSRRLH